MTCEPFEIVAVPFPFSEATGSKRRPALVLSQNSFNENGYTILAMITTQSHPAWPGDWRLKDHGAEGLLAECLVRLKLFTLDNRLIMKKIGQLTQSDRAGVMEHLRSNLHLS